MKDVAYLCFWLCVLKSRLYTRLSSGHSKYHKMSSIQGTAIVHSICDETAMNCGHRYSSENSWAAVKTVKIKNYLLIFSTNNERRTILPAIENRRIRNDDNETGQCQHLFLFFTAEVCQQQSDTTDNMKITEQVPMFCDENFYVIWSDTVIAYQ